MESKQHNFNHMSKDIIKSVQSTMANNLLDRSYLKCQHSLSKELLEMSSIDHDGLIREQIRQRLSQQIIGVTQQHIKTEDYHDARVYSLELFVLPPEDLKCIVEWYIREMSMESINKIKNNEQ